VSKTWNLGIRCTPTPLGWAKPSMIVVNSKSDLFHENVSFDFIDKVFAVAALTPQHTYQVLTKRPDRMAEYLESRQIGTPDAAMNFKGAVLSNVWLGTSVESQSQVCERHAVLRRCAAAVRFYSVEPLLSLINLDLEGIGWVIVGGESGRRARPNRIEWVRSIVKQCKDANVPCFVKQLGLNVWEDIDGWGSQYAENTFWFTKHRNGGDMTEWPEDLRVRQMPEMCRAV